MSDLKPNYKTIANFRSDNAKALRKANKDLNDKLEKLKKKQEEKLALQEELKKQRRYTNFHH